MSTDAHAELQKANAEHYYIALDEAGNLTKRKLLLSGAPRKFASDPTFVYLRAFHVAGSQNAAMLFLAKGGNPQTLAGAYTVTTIGQPQFEKDVLAQKAYQAAQKSVAGPSRSVAQPTYLTLAELAAVPAVVAVTKSPRGKGKRAVSPGSAIGRTGPRETLAERLRNLEAGKSLDVSKMAADGTGVQTAARPAKTSKFSALDRALISKDEANLVRALKEVGQPNAHIDGPTRLAPVKGGRPKSKSSPKPRGRRPSAKVEAIFVPVPVASPVRSLSPAPVLAAAPARMSPARSRSPRRAASPAAQIAAMPGSFVATTAGPSALPAGFSLPTFSGFRA